MEKIYQQIISSKDITLQAQGLLNIANKLYK